MYNVYLGDMLCPVAPEKIVVNYNDGCETVDLADGGEIGVPRGNSLRVIGFSLLLPNSEYPFAVYKSGFCAAGIYLDKLEELLREKKPFQFIVTRAASDAKLFHSTNVKCLVESLQVEDNAELGFDVRVKVKLREYRDFAAKKLDLNAANALLKFERGRENSPEPKSKSVFYRVVKGDCMWMIAQRFYGNGNLYERIYNANRHRLAGRSPRCLIFVGDVLEIPPLG